MQNLVGLGVADSAEQPRIGERTFDRVALRSDARRELVEARVEHLESAPIELGEGRLAANHVQRCAATRHGW